MKTAFAALCLLLISFKVSAWSDTINIFKETGINYGTDGDTLQQLDIFFRKDTAAKPVIIFVHGGGWRTGNKRDYYKMAEALAEQGYTIVLVNYRLSPAVKFPAHINDIAAAFYWVYSNIAKYGGSSKNIFLAGHSAGAHLISLLTLNPLYLGRFHLRNKGIAGIITFSGVFDIKPQEGGATPAFLNAVFGNDTLTWRNASASTWLIKKGNLKKPPFMIVYASGENGLLVKESEEFAGKLTTAGYYNSKFIIKTENHWGFLDEMCNNQSALWKEVEKFIAVFSK